MEHILSATLLAQVDTALTWLKSANATKLQIKENNSVRLTNAERNTLKQSIEDVKEELKRL
ncbi:hypothetical protein M0R04_10115 [Candidatus Dojkabacteria bacterium]|jgi:hypothetical protein|nr:hypothetical protein [Candidatus Dojkabacteria bacterium]